MYEALLKRSDTKEDVLLKYMEILGRMSYQVFNISRTLKVESVLDNSLGRRWSIAPFYKCIDRIFWTPSHPYIHIQRIY